MPNREQYRELTSRVYALAQDAMLGEITADDAAALQQLVVNDPVARDIYTSFILDSIVLRDLSLNRAPFDGVETAIAAPSAPFDSSGAIASQEPSPPTGGGWGFSATAFALGLLFAIGIIAWNQSDRPRSGVRPYLANESDVNGQPQAQLNYVARIINASPDCRWDDTFSPDEFLLRMRAGNRMQLAEGLIELEFCSGARIILRGPAVFTPTGPAQGSLESGHLTGNLDNGNFSVRTPTADVIDLVPVQDAALALAESRSSSKHSPGTDIVVLDGRVRVVPRPANADRESNAGNPNELAASDLVSAAELGPFALNVAGTRLAREVSLIDVMAGGSGAGNRLAGAIDPLTGQKCFAAQTPIRALNGDGKYHLVDWHPLIDGIFIPTTKGRSIQVDSLGGAVDLPPGCGRTWTCVWSRSTQTIGPSPDAGADSNFWGGCTIRPIVQQLSQAEHGLVGLHANVGITFDLGAMQVAHQRVPLEFRGSVANLDSSFEYLSRPRDKQKHTADLRIYVDGKLRYSRLSFGREDGNEQFSVRLGADDRFLTIIASDDGDFDWDQVALIDPIVVLASEANDSDITVSPSTYRSHYALASTSQHLFAGPNIFALDRRMSGFPFVANSEPIVVSELSRRSVYRP